MLFREDGTYISLIYGRKPLSIHAYIKLSLREQIECISLYNGQLSFHLQLELRSYLQHFLLVNPDLQLVEQLTQRVFVVAALAANPFTWPIISLSSQSVNIDNQPGAITSSYLRAGKKLSLIHI